MSKAVRVASLAAPQGTSEQNNRGLSQQMLWEAKESGAKPVACSRFCAIWTRA
jgi:hypothetical protein